MAATPDMAECNLYRLQVAFKLGGHGSPVEP